MRNIVLTFAAAISSIAASQAALPLLTGPSGGNPAAFPADIPDVNSVINQLNQSATQAFDNQLNPRNLLDNGAMLIQQRGTGTQTCGGTSGTTSTAYSADRWVCDVNVTSGAGRAAAVTTSLPTGFSGAQSLFRTSGALTQPVCLMQEIPTSKALMVAGMSVVPSLYLKDLGGLVGDNGGSVQVQLFYGTGTDEGLKSSFTASPAITPAWTGITTSAALSFTINASWSRYVGAAIFVPSTATEIAESICFTPTATGAGATDGLVTTGVQLEASSGASSPFEFLPFEAEFLRSVRNGFYRINEPASGAGVNGICEATGAATNACTMPIPVQMRAATPTITITTAGTFKVNIAGTATTIATPTASTCSSTACEITAANTNTAGQIELLTGGGGTGAWDISGDF